MLAYQIPPHDQEPSDEMIEFLHENPEEWEGDESGICLCGGEDPSRWQYGAPGDWVVRRDDGKYVIVMAGSETWAVLVQEGRTTWKNQV